MAPHHTLPEDESEVPASFRQPLRVASLSSRKPNRFKLDPNTETRAEIAQALDLLGLPKFRMKGELSPSGSRDFVLTAHIDAVVVQACVVSLSPVETVLSEEVSRRFVADWVEPDGDEVEMPEDDSAEPLPEIIDLGHVALEALALALPLYPRATGATMDEMTATPPGAEPIRDVDLKPFAGLASLKAKLGGGETET